MSKLSTRPQNKNFGERSGRQTSTRRHKEFKTKYYRSPKICPQCDGVISYEKRYNKFCSHSCSASFTNKNRTINNRKNASDTPTKNNKRNFCAVTFKQCPTCNIWYRNKGGNSQYCTPMCNPEFYSKKSYRTQCKFKLSSNQHSELFNLELIQKHGWYVPANHSNPTNLTGVCWDHLYRIEEGYQNRIDPSIMSHPANAELVPWPENKARKQSLITYEELLRRIHQWDNGIHTLPNFYQNV